MYFCAKPMNMENILVRSHSGLRWIVLVLLIGAIVNAFSMSSKNQFEKKDRLLYMFAMVSMHLQLVLGLALYFLSKRVQFSEGWMGDSKLRFFNMEHLVMMIAAIAIVTIGHIRAKKAPDNNAKHATIRLWYIIGFIILLAGIPWPFRNLGITGWF
jgi:cation transport ATPase